METSQKILIVGQGLAGSLLADAAAQNGLLPTVVDDPRPPKSTSVAAGLVNPIVLRSLNKVWKADVALPEAVSTYARLEAMTGRQFFHHRPIFKFLNSNELKAWQKKMGEASLLDYLAPPEENPFDSQEFHSTPQVGRVLGSGYLDTQVFLEAMADWLTAKGWLARERFEHAELDLSGPLPQWRGQAFGRIVFCEGWHHARNPYFDWLPSNSTKGEVLAIESDSLRMDGRILSKGIFVLPVGPGRFKVGATYRWDDLDCEPTEEGREELLRKLQTIVKGPFRVVEHRAGVRPTTPDRRPILGWHPLYPSLGLLNGFGSRGVLMGPWLAAQLAESVAKGSPVMAELDVRRFWVDQAPDD